MTLILIYNIDMSYHPQHAEEEENDEKRYTVIITAFGLHDASSKSHVYTNSVHHATPGGGEQQQQEDIRLVGDVRFTALAACRNATADLVHAAAAAAVGGNGGSGDSSNPTPLVFLLRNNDFVPGSATQEFLDGVHRLQEEEIHEERIRIRNTRIEVAGQQRRSGGVPGSSGDREDDGATSNDDIIINGGGGEGIFVVDDSVSLSRKMAYYRIDTSVHFHEPVKVMEAKMLWDLIYLVDSEKNATVAKNG